MNPPTPTETEIRAVTARYRERVSDPDITWVEYLQLAREFRTFCKNHGILDWLAQLETEGFNA